MSEIQLINLALASGFFFLLGVAVTVIAFIKTLSVTVKQYSSEVKDKEKEFDAFKIEAYRIIKPTREWLDKLTWRLGDNVSPKEMEEIDKVRSTLTHIVINGIGAFMKPKFDENEYLEDGETS